jgi:hypothetical protein
MNPASNDRQCLLPLPTAESRFGGSKSSPNTAAFLRLRRSMCGRSPDLPGWGSQLYRGSAPKVGAQPRGSESAASGKSETCRTSGGRAAVSGLLRLSVSGFLREKRNVIVCERV